MTERPDYICCIADPDRQHYGLCGRMTGFEFRFVDLSHVLRNAEDRGRLLPCPECWKAAGMPEGAEFSLDRDGSAITFARELTADERNALGQAMAEAVGVKWEPAD